MTVRRDWTTIAVVWLTLAVSYGIYFSFSVFLVPLLEEFHWSRAVTAGAFSVSTVLQGALSPVIGVLVDRFGTRPVLVIGVVSLSSSSLLASTVHAPWQLYLYAGTLAALGMVCLGWVPMGVLIARSFRDARGRVIGTAFSGMGIGVFAMGPIAEWLIARAGWRVASATLGVTTLVLLLPVVWLGVPPDRQPSAKSSVREPSHASGATVTAALRTRAFWALFFAYFLTPLAVFPVFTHQVAYATDLGFSRTLAAWVVGIVGLASTAGRPVFGTLADRSGGPLAATLSYASSAIGVLALAAAERVPAVTLLLAYATLFGLGFGARGPIITTMASERFGGRRFGAIWGALNVANGIGGAVGPWFGGAVHDATGSYRIVFACTIVFCAMGSVCFWVAGRDAPIDTRALTHS